MESTERPSVAVVGSGAAGLAAAWLLARGRYNVHLFESASRPGGHANTLDIPIPSASPPFSVPVDTGYIVYNAQTYPDLVSLFQLLGVDEENSCMSFSSSVCLPSGRVMEWGSDTLDALFADRSNLYRPTMYTMLYDMYRFNNAVHDFVHAARDPSFKLRNITLSQFLEQGAYSTVFIQAYLIPMVSAVWSASYTSALQFPARSLFHFFVNHGLAQVFSRPQWRTPAKRSRDYISRLLTDFRAHGGAIHLSAAVSKIVRQQDHVTVFAAGREPAQFHHVVFATHPPDTLQILGDCATEDERRLLSAFSYSSNKAFVHHDPNLMPSNRTVWSSWNFIGPRQPSASASCHDPSSSNSPVASPAKPTEIELLHKAPDAIYSSECAIGNTCESTLPNETCEPSMLPESDVPHSHQSASGPSKTNNINTDSLGDDPVCVSYWLNRLQNLHKYHVAVPDIFLTLNPVVPIDSGKVLIELTYEHPQFTEAAVQAQSGVQSLLQGKNRTWFCGAWTRYGFHQDAFMSGLEIAERISNHAIVRPWEAKNQLAINDNSQKYLFPCSPLRAPLFIYFIALVVVNMVLGGLQAGLGKIAAHMSHRDPSVVVADGNGKLYRFGPSRSRRQANSFFTFARLSELSGSLDVSQPSAARLTVRSPKVLVRITDALRKGVEIAPTAAAAFAAAELDCPSPTDLSESLRTLFIADALDKPSNARPGRAKLAENLLYVLIGNFEDVSSMPIHTRLPELTTCMSSVINPPWWLEMDDEHESTAWELCENSCRSKVSPRDLRNVKNIMELLGDLSEMTVALLQMNSSCHATVIAQTAERMSFVNRKADLLSVKNQVSVTLLEEFRKEHESVFRPSCDLEQEELCYDLILSPAILNNHKSCGFESLVNVMNVLRCVACSDAIIELGATVCGKQRETPKDVSNLQNNRILCSDPGYELWSTSDILQVVDSCGLNLEQVRMMDEAEAAMDVHEVVQRVYTSLATDKLEAGETRRVLAQMCLWQAALSVKYIRRVAISITLN